MKKHEIMLYIKIIITLLAIIGLSISLGEMLDCFIDKDRINFTKIMETNLECPKDHPGARKFINDFILTNPEYRNMKFATAKIEKVVYVGTWLGGSNNETGHQVESVSSGTLKLKANNGQVTKPLCSFEDLKDWSIEAPFWKWLGWGIVAISVFLGIVLLVVEEIIRGKNSI